MTNNQNYLIYKTMSLISFITLLVSIMLLIALCYHKKDLEDDFKFFRAYGEHLYDPKKLEERGKILFWVAVCNLFLALGNLVYTFSK